MIPGIILFPFSSLRRSPVITTTGRTVAMHGLPLCGSGGLIPGIILFPCRPCVGHRSSVITTTGKTVAMRGLPLRGSGN